MAEPKNEVINTLLYKAAMEEWNDRYWLGIRKYDSNSDIMVWESDSSTVLWTNWESHQPNHDGDCVYILNDFNGTRFDTHCSNEYFIICEFFYETVIPTSTSATTTMITQTEGPSKHHASINNKYRAASCKKSIRKNKLTRKNKSTRNEILYLKIPFLVDLQRREQYPG